MLSLSAFWLLLFLNDRASPVATFSPSLHFDPPPGEAAITKPYSLAVDEMGNHYLLDISENKIFVWDAAGRWLRSIGKRGEGPGELTIPDSWGLLTTTSEHLLVYEHAKLHIWRLDGTYEKTMSLGSRPGRWFELHAYGEELLILEVNREQQENHLFTLDRSLKHSAPLYALEGAEYRRNDRGGWDYHPFTDRLVVGVLGDQIWYGNANDNWVHMRQGEETVAFRVPLTQEEISRDEVISFRKRFQRWAGGNDRLMMKNATQPNFDYLFPLANGQLLVTQYRAQENRCLGIVVDGSSGVVKARFQHRLGNDESYMLSAAGHIFFAIPDEDGEYQLSRQQMVIQDK